MHPFVLANDRLINPNHITKIDLSQVERLQVTLTLYDGSEEVVSGIRVVDLLMQIRPGALEGRRLRWVRHAWAVHNLVGHPAMQVFAWLGRPDWALKVHDFTIPRPLGKKPKS